jgi:hypothetical protein
MRTNPKEPKFTVTKIETRRAGSRNPDTRIITELTGTLARLKNALDPEEIFKPQSTVEKLVKVLNKGASQYSNNTTSFQVGHYEGGVSTIQL